MHWGSQLSGCRTDLRSLYYVRPLRRWASTHLFYFDFVMLCFRRGFRGWVLDLRSDQRTRRSAHFRKAEVDSWIRDLQLTDGYTFFRNQNAWNFGGRKAAPAPRTVSSLKRLTRRGTAKIVVSVDRLVACVIGDSRSRGRRDKRRTPVTVCWRRLLTVMRQGTASART